MSKIKGVSEHLAALLQKKIRIDLEIKRTKNQLTKLKKRSSTQLKLSASLEAANPGDQEESVYLSLVGGPQGVINTQNERLIAQADKLIQEVEAIEQYLIPLD